MEAIATVVVLLVMIGVVYKLGGFGMVVEMTDVSTRQATVYNREHKGKVAKRYEQLAVDVDAEKVNANIAKIDGLNFD